MSKSFIISDIFNKGLGFISTREIKSGELIVEERAGMTLAMGDINEDKINKKYKKLTTQ